MPNPTTRPARLRFTTPLSAFHDGTTYRLHRTCGCGCGAIVPSVYAQGHDMIAKSKGLK